MHLHAAMSPLAKTNHLTPIRGYGKTFLFDMHIANPFVEKQGIVSHNARQEQINRKMSTIQNIYRNH